MLKIREHKKFGTCLSNEAIEYIYTTLKSNHKEQMSYCSIDCTQIIEDYATLMAQIEELAREDKEKNNNEELTCTITLTPVSEIPKNNTPFFSRVFNTKSLSTLGKILGAVCVAAPAVSALVTPRCR